MTSRLKTWTFAAVAAAALCGVLGLYRATDAAQRADAPLANPAEQRLEQIHHLKAIRDLLKEQNTLLKEQNSLLKSGRLQVVVTLPEG